MSERTPAASRFAISPFQLLCTTGLFAIFSSTMSKSPVLPLFAKDLGATETSIGFIAAASTVVGILASIPAGALSDIYGRRRVIVAAMLVFASAPFLYLLVTNPWQLAFVRVYHGFATAIFGPVAMALVADLFRTGRGESMGWYSSATLVGRSIAPAVGGLILLSAAYPVVYAVCGVAGLLALALGSRLPVDNRTQKSASFAESWTKLRSGLRDVVRSRPILVTSVTEALMYFSFGALEGFLPLYAVFVAKLSTVEVGAIFLVQVLTTALTKPIMGRWSDRVGRRPMIVLGLGVSALSLALIMSTGLFPLMMLLGVVYGLGLSVVTSSTSAYVSELAKAGSYGSAMGVLSTIMDVGQTLGPIVAGFAIVAFGYGSTFAGIAALLVVGTLGFWTLTGGEARTAEHTT